MEGPNVRLVPLPKMKSVFFSLTLFLKSHFRPWMGSLENRIGSPKPRIGFCVADKDDLSLKTVIFYRMLRKKCFDSSLYISYLQLLHLSTGDIPRHFGRSKSPSSLMFFCSFFAYGVIFGPGFICDNWFDLTNDFSVVASGASEGSAR